MSARSAPHPSAAYRRAWRDQRIAKGLCDRCGEPSPGGFASCAECRKLRLLKNKERAAARTSAYTAPERHADRRVDARVEMLARLDEAAARAREDAPTAIAAAGPRGAFAHEVAARLGWSLTRADRALARAAADGLAFKFGKAGEELFRPRPGRKAA
jgi:hypothetical protein